MLALPICTAVMAFLFLGERMTRIRWISFGLAMIGVVMCSDIDYGNLNFGTGFLLGNVLILVGLNGSAFLNSYSKKVLQRYTPVELLFYTYLAMFVILTPLLVIMEGDVFSRIAVFTRSTWLGLFILALFHNWLSMVLFLKALKTLDATQAALSNYLITFFGLPIAAIWLDERLSPVAIIGGILVLGSTLLITLFKENRDSGLSG